jgi:hypothetical protein
LLVWLELYIQMMTKAEAVPNQFKQGGWDVSGFHLLLTFNSGRIAQTAIVFLTVRQPAHASHADMIRKAL